MGKNTVYYGDNLTALKELPSESVQLIYIDPPFHTGKVQRRTQVRADQSKQGEHIGFRGMPYKITPVKTMLFEDRFEDYLAFLEPRMQEAYRVLAPNGSLYFHIDYRNAHICRMLLDSIFGVDNLLNEIIWSYDYGGRSKKRWPAKHDNIYYYVKDKNHYTFRAEDCDRLPYMAPNLVTEEKAARGKFPTDVWWHTIVPTNGTEKTGYPTQKPLGIIRRIIKVSSNPGDMVLDFFAGSGTVGVAAHELGRNFMLMENSSDAMNVILKRLVDIEFETHIFERRKDFEIGV